jgi:hypothetical protein
MCVVDIRTETRSISACGYESARLSSENMRWKGSAWNWICALFVNVQPPSLQELGVSHENVACN